MRRDHVKKPKKTIFITNLNDKHMRNVMKLNRFVLLTLPLFFLTACNSVKLVVDYDGDVDFGSYKTYMILPWREQNSKLVSELNQKRLYTALENEMNARGYTRVSSNADLAVNILVIIEESTNYTAYRDYYQGGGWGYYYPFGYGYSTVRYESFDVLMGTVLVDVFDHQKKKLIFQSAAIAEVKEQNRNREQEINRIMSKIFWEFPVKKKK